MPSHSRPPSSAVADPAAGPGPVRNGFTLIEVMVAMIILTVGVLGLAATTLVYGALAALLFAKRLRVR